MQDQHKLTQAEKSDKQQGKKQKNHIENSHRKVVQERKLRDEDERK